MFSKIVSVVIIIIATGNILLGAAAVGGNFASLQAALAELGELGGEVYLPAGRYVVTSPILLNSNVTLRGAGAATVLVAGQQLDAALREEAAYLNEDEFSILFNPQYRHAAVIKNADSQGNKGIRIYDLTIEMDRDQLRCVSGIMLHNTERTIIRGVTVSDCGGSAIILNNCRDAKLSELLLERDHNGVYVKGHKSECRDVTITNSTFRENRWSGIYVNKSGAHGGSLIDGPENITITNNQFYDHMTDTAIKLHGPRFVIITANRIDRALEAGIECNGAHDMVCSDNIVTRVDDGMNLRGNGCAISFGRQVRPANLAINGNITTESGVGIWCESIFKSTSGLQQGAVGGVTVTGNVAQGNVAYGMGGCSLKDSAWVGNVNIDNGQHVPPPGQDTVGMLFSAGCERMSIVGNVASDRRSEEENLMQSAMVIRSSDNLLADDNVLFNGAEHDLKEYANGQYLQLQDNLMPHASDSQAQ